MAPQEDPDDVRPCLACGKITSCQRPCLYCNKPVPARYIGATVAQKYRVEGLLGQGGMGAVYHAIHGELQERVAIKFLRPQFAASADARERFRREVVALVRLRHPGIVTILDAGEYEGVPFMVMELLRGQALSDISLGGVVLAPQRVYAMMDQILGVLDGAHRVGIVHRDLKPENVFLLEGRGADTVKLLDFGIAQISASPSEARLTQAGSVFGTPYYMSPEQCRGQPVGPPTDVYAAAVMLFELLSGELPFRAESAAEIMAQHLYVAPPRVSERGQRPQVPPAVESLLLRLMAKDPVARPSAARFRDELAAAVRGGPAAVAPGSLRPAHAALAREDRALTVPQQQAPDLTPPPGARALVWHPDPARAGVLQATLGASGFVASCWVAHEAPPPQPADPPRVVLIPSSPRALDMLKELRQHPQLRAAPVLVFDVGRADEVPGYIRAGASDVALYSAGDTELTPKILRLLRRGR